MDAVKIEILNRGGKGQVVLVRYASVFELNTPMILKQGEIVIRMDLIREYEVIVQGATAGLTNTMKIECVEMGGEGSILVSQMKEYFKAPLTADPIEFGKIDFSLTDLIRGKSEDIYARNMMVFEVFDNYKKDMILKNYPVTLLMGTSYETAITNYHTAVPGFRDGEVVKNAANLQIGIQCRILTNENFPSIKNFVLPYKKANALFYSQIEIAYKGRDVVARRKSIEVHCKELETSIDVVGYDAILVASDGTQHVMKGGKKGFALFNSLPTDVYYLLLKRKGYIDKRINSIGYTAGKFLKIDTVMVIGVNPLFSDAAVKAAVVAPANDKGTVITEVKQDVTDEENDTETPEATEPTKE